MAASDEETLSPKNRLKFLCSYGGKILPRPSDGQLKYIGGETRALAVPRSITFSELKEKINGMFNSGDVLIKYQMMPEDLDALVSVRSDEDLHHMIEEYNRHEHHPRSPTSAGSSRFRLFLISAPSTPPSPHPGPAPLDHHYVETVNRTIFALSASANTSPANTSPTNTIDATNLNHAALILSGRPRRLIRQNSDGGGMHRVRSTPNLVGHGAIVSARPHHRHVQPKHATGYGVYPCSSGAPWKGTSVQLMNGGSQYEVCGCGCGCPIMGQQQQMMRTYYYPPGVVGPSGGCVCCGHMDDAGVPRSGQGFHSSGAPAPPRKPATFE